MRGISLFLLSLCCFPGIKIWVQNSLFLFMQEEQFIFLNIYYLFILFLWLLLVLVVTRRIFVEACGIFHCSSGALHCCAQPSLQLCVGFLSSCSMRAPERVGSVVCDTWALQLRRASSVVVAGGISCPVACGVLVRRPGIEPASPALKGGFFTTGPPGKSQQFIF